MALLLPQPPKDSAGHRPFLKIILFLTHSDLYQQLLEVKPSLVKFEQEVLG